jgi:hypothetical protein
MEKCFRGSKIPSRTVKAKEEEGFKHKGNKINIYE